MKDHHILKLFNKISSLYRQISNFLKENLEQESINGEEANIIWSIQNKGSTHTGRLAKEEHYMLPHVTFHVNNLSRLDFLNVKIETMGLVINVTEKGIKLIDKTQKLKIPVHIQQQIIRFEQILNKV